MEIRAEINGRSVVLSGAADERLRDVLYRSGYTSVRDSDDREGFSEQPCGRRDGEAEQQSGTVFLYKIHDR